MERRIKMPYINDEQRYFDLIALALGMKDNDKFDNEDDKLNYTILFSAYIKMIEQDKEEFFIGSTQKEKIIASLKRSIEFYNFTSPEELTRSLQQMTLNDPTDFMLLPISYFISDLEPEALPSLSSEISEPFTILGHASGILIYKVDNGYKFVMVDKVRRFGRSQVGFTTVPPENLLSICTYLYTENNRIYSRRGFNKLLHIKKKS
jgi:hypothetical protein